MTDYNIPFNRKAVRPVECIRGGWELVKSQYWLFFGMCLVGLLVGSAVPLGILMGPMMCGMYLSFFKTRRGEPIEFATLFKGFDYFGQSVIASILHTIPIMAIIIAAYIIFYAGFIVSVVALGDNPNPAAGIAVLLMMLVFWFVLMIVIIVITLGFTFAYPLIVDRGMQGFDAVKLSFQAAMANFLPLLGMSLLGMLLGTAGVLACYIGIFFVMPITYASMAVAYEQVFGLSTGVPVGRTPPPPPSFN